MTDKTMLAIGRNSYSVTRLTKRALQAVTSAVLAALATLLILLVNNLLMAKNGWQQGFDLWLAFIRRSDIMGTMLLTAVVTVAFIYWQRSYENR